MENEKIAAKTVLVTGANGGLGLETCKILAQHNFSRITMATRTSEKAHAAKTELLSAVQPKGKIEVAYGFDMNSPEGIEAAVASLPAKQPFDVIFFQVGGVIFTEDYQYIEWNGRKIEKTIFQNVIGSHITLINLRKRGLVAPKARIVFAGGEGVRGIPGMIDNPIFETADEFNRYLFGRGEQEKYNPMNAIGVSKLASAFLVQKLAEFNDGSDYIWFSPGLTHGTNGLASVAPLKRFFMEKIMFGISGLLGFSQSPQKGAMKYVDCLSGKIGKNGEILGAPKGKVLGPITDQKPMNPSITDPSLRDEFWNILAAIYPYAPNRLVNG